MAYGICLDVWTLRGYDKGGKKYQRWNRIQSHAIISTASYDGFSKYKSLVVVFFFFSFLHWNNFTVLCELPFLQKKNKIKYAENNYKQNSF